MPHDYDESHVHNLLPAEPALRVKALETILLEKGLMDQQAVDAIIDEYEQRIGPHIGAKIVAKAGNDPAFIRCHGVHVLPNTNAHFRGEHPENLYAVEFKASVLWEQTPSLSDTVVVDCWESYLEAA